MRFWIVFEIINYLFKINLQKVLNKATNTALIFNLIKII